MLAGDDSVKAEVAKDREDYTLSRWEGKSWKRAERSKGKEGKVNPSALV